VRMATQDAPGRSRRFVPPVPAEAAPRAEIQVLENPIFQQSPPLGRAVEEEIRRALQNEPLGTLQVRFRVCRDEDEGLRFICKVENPPTVDVEGSFPAWRWWSPLLSSAEDLRKALAEGLQVRRQRLASSSRHSAA
jgi:hypothetical protein